MKYFIDTEFVEGKPTESTSWLILKRRGGGFTFGLPKPTIDLISVGIVCEDGREYYAISKDFDLKEAWNRWQPKEHNLPMGIIKDYWVRDNVLKPIWKELRIHYSDELDSKNHYNHIPDDNTFNYKDLKFLINKYGKTNNQIAEEVIKFCKGNDDPIYSHVPSGIKVNIGKPNTYIPSEYSVEVVRTNPKFYGYYANYDWVAFCWLFGTMMNLPKGFPMYCIDLKQELDSNVKSSISLHCFNHKRLKNIDAYNNGDLTEALEIFKSHEDYPKQTNEHHALSDARWNYKLYEFLNSI